MDGDTPFLPTRRSELGRDRMLRSNSMPVGPRCAAAYQNFSGRAAARPYR
jgi:hypothetical protein